MLASRVLVPATTSGGHVIVAIVDTERDPASPATARTPRTTTPRRASRSTACGSRPTTCSARPPTAARSSRGSSSGRRPAVRHRRRRLRAGVAPDRRRTRRSASSSSRPIATFQAVGQRAADAYIDTEAIRLTALAGRVAPRRGARRRRPQVAVAKFWAAEGGQRGRRTPPSTCTAAWASTATTRCTATSCGRR